MGDGMTNTPWDVFMYLLVFGGVPFLAVVLPLIVAPLVYRIAKPPSPGQTKSLPSHEGGNDQLLDSSADAECDTAT